MARSLQVGLAALPDNCLAAFVALADQPEIHPATLTSVLQRWRETQAPCVAPFFQGQRGHPLLFDRQLWPQIMALPPDANPRQVLEALGGIEQVVVDDGTILRDVDTPADYARALARRAASG
jgi:molybdenum cofactor cytidylyltransferase